MRRIVVVATALAVLIAAASAFAATGGLNGYTAKLSFSPNKAGSVKVPSSLAYTEKYVATGTGGNRTAPLTDITDKMYGLVVDGKDFPTCSAAQIEAAGNDTACPKGALVATGSIAATLGLESNTSTSAPGQLSCDPLLDAWNAGQGKVVFFFIAPATGNHACADGALTTGGLQPFVGTFKTVGKNLVLDTPIPTKISFPLPGYEGSLTRETLNWKNLSKKLKNGNTVHYSESVACKGGKRPYSVTFTAESAGGGPQSSTVTGTQKCS